MTCRATGVFSKTQGKKVVAPTPLRGVTDFAAGKFRGPEGNTGPLALRPLVYGHGSPNIERVR